MLTFFRKIRYELLEKKKIARYLKYALGEILLVVIGILIALQINNANENAKLRKQEVILLKNIKEDISLDTTDINFNIAYHHKILSAEKELLQFLMSDLDEPGGKMDYDNALGVPLIITLHRSAFTNLENTQTGLISNNDLKKEISRLYDFFQNTITLLENNLESYQTYTTKLPYFKKYFEPSAYSYSIDTSDENDKIYSSIGSEKASLIFSDQLGAKKDSGFKIELNESIFKRQLLISLYEDMLKRIKELNQSIDLDIANRSN